MNICITIHDKFDREKFSTLELENQIFVFLFYICCICFLQFAGTHILLFFSGKIRKGTTADHFPFSNQLLHATVLLIIWLMPKKPHINAGSQRL